MLMSANRDFSDSAAEVDFNKSEEFEMFLTVCEVEYRVFITSQPLINAAGKRVLALARESERTICISAKASADQRMDLLRLELPHLFMWAVAQPRTPLETEQLKQTVERTLRVQLGRQGGERALMALVPIERPSKRITRSGSELLEPHSTPLVSRSGHKANQQKKKG